MPQRSSRGPTAGHRVVELLLGAAPTVAFLVVESVTGALARSVVAAGITAAAVFGWHLLRGNPCAEPCRGC